MSTYNYSYITCHSLQIYVSFQQKRVLLRVTTILFKFFFSFNLFRSEAENQYAKSLSKLSHKLLKTSKDAVGSVSEAWQRLGAEMEAESEIHRTFAAALCEEVVKPLKQLIDSQHRIRKNVEGVVDKTGTRCNPVEGLQVESVECAQSLGVSFFQVKH